MIIVLKPGTPDEDVNHVVEKVSKAGLTPHISKGVERTLIMVIGDDRILAELPLETMPGVEKVMSVLQPFKLVSREFQKTDTIIKIKNLEIGGRRLHVMAGPCSVESREALIEVAKKVKAAGATILRGGAFKPRTSPYAFQGMGEDGLKILSEARDITGLPIVTEVMDTRTVGLVARYTDIIQLGARNMQNFELLKEVGESKVPVLLKM